MGSTTREQTKKTKLKNQSPAWCRGFASWRNLFMIGNIYQILKTKHRKHRTGSITMETKKTSQNKGTNEQRNKGIRAVPGVGPFHPGEICSWLATATSRTPSHNRPVWHLKIKIDKIFLGISISLWLPGYKTLCRYLQQSPTETD